MFIDKCLPDTLYRISLSSDESKGKANASSHSHPDDAKPLFGWSSSILRHSKSSTDVKGDVLKSSPVEESHLTEKAIMVSTLGTSHTRCCALVHIRD